MPLIEVFADIVCPFTHVGLRRVAAERDARGRSDVTLHVRAWPLELVNNKPMDPEFLRTEIDPLRASVAPDLFNGFDAATFPTTSLPGFALTAAAYRESAVVGEAVAMDIRTALFEQGANVAEPDVLEPIAARHGVPMPDVDGERANIVADWNDGKARGAVGSPHFFIQGEGFFCPTLKIKHDDSGFHISVNEDAVQEFFDRCFGAPAN